MNRKVLFLVQVWEITWATNGSGKGMLGIFLLIGRQNVKLTKRRGTSEKAFKVHFAL